MASRSGKAKRPEKRRSVPAPREPRTRGSQKNSVNPREHVAASCIVGIGGAAGGFDAYSRTSAVERNRARARSFPVRRGLLALFPPSRASLPLQRVPRGSDRLQRERSQGRVRQATPSRAANRRGESPAINVARMMLNYVDCCHRLHLLLRNGDSLPVEAAMRSVHVGTGPIFVVGLRWPNAPTACGEEG
jgi:hypothetical protein